MIEDKDIAAVVRFLASEIRAGRSDPELAAQNLEAVGGLIVGYQKDAQRLAALLERLRVLEIEWADPECDCCLQHSEVLTNLLAAHGFPSPGEKAP